jgi:uncharacterized protein
MKILAAGDIHGDVELTKKLAERAVKENVDLVILNGDLTFFEQSIENIIGPFEKVGKKVLVLPGNHESLATIDFLAQRYYNTINLHGSYFILGDIGIFGAGGVPEVGPFSRISESELYKLLKKGFEGVKKSKFKIMATHVHPEKSLIDDLSPFLLGSSSVERIIKKFNPDIALCSHVHEAWGIEETIGKTKLINVGREGKIIEV